MRFKRHRITFNDAEGSNHRLSKSFGMYDIATAVTISGEKSTSGGDAIGHTSKKPKVYCDSRGKWLVVAAGGDVSVFDLAVGVEHKWTVSFKETDEVICVKFLPDDDLFFIILSSGLVTICMPAYSVSKEEAILPPLSSCSVSIVNEAEKYVICVLENKGSAHILEMNKISTAVKRELDSISPLKLLFSSEKISCQHVFPQYKGDRVKVAPIHCTSNDRFSDWFKLREEVRAIKNVGNFIVALTANNQLIFYNLNLTELHVMNVAFADPVKDRGEWAESRKALDFEFLDVGAFAEFESDVRILFKVKTDSEPEFVLKSLGDPATLFNSTCADEVTLIPHATQGDDSNIIFVEAFSKTEPNDIVVRFVSEAQPSLRLKRLLDVGRFSDALDFAKKNDLSLDIVYIALIRKCQDEILSESGYEESVFDEMMKYLALLSDHDLACDFCVAALTAVNKYEHIVKVLEFTQKEKIKDNDTIRAILDFRYELGSYRLLYGASLVSYDRSSEWPSFLSADNHLTLFDKFCETGAITEARILLNRYPAEILNHLSPTGATDRLLSLFSTSITENPATNVHISEFIESDLLKFFLLNVKFENSVSNSKNLFNFLVDTAKSLERIQSKGFPENSLFFALSFQRGLTTLKQNCLTSDQQVEPILVLDQLDVDSYDENLPSGRLNVLVRNLKNLVRIHRVYQCPMSYSEFINRDVHSICSGILDRVRTAQSVRDHIESFVFPYMVEHNLDKNEMLHRYIKNLASMLYRGSAQYSNSWDQLCLQIAENIMDADLRCKAVIEIAAGSIPPWSEQLMTVVKNTLTHVDDVDPTLIQQLRVECRRAELGQIFVAYHIPLSFRSMVMDIPSLKALLQFIFRNSDKEPSVRLNDAFKIVSIYENLMGFNLMVTRAECFRLYAISIIMQLADEYDLAKLVNFFQLSKSPEERAEVAWKLVQYLKCLIVETKVKKVQQKRLIWLASLLCVLERFVPKDAHADAVIQQARNIRCLQVNHGLIIGFATLNNEKKCVEHLTNFITHHSSKKSLFEVVAFGRLFSMSMRQIFKTIVDLQIEKGLAEASMVTLEFYIEKELAPQESDLNACLRVCTAVLWNITSAAVDTGTEFEPLVRIVKLFKSTLPVLINWSVRFQSTLHVEFCKINGYISLLGDILDLCAVDKSEFIEREETKSPDEYDCLKKTEKIYTNRRRVGAFLPSNENSFFEHNNVIRNTAIVASSVVKPPLDGEENIEKFNNEMVEYWHRLYESLSTHSLLEISARQFSHSLPCFAIIREINGPVMHLRHCISELCQKMLNVSTPDLFLAAHLLLRLPNVEMKCVLQELRRWVTNNRKSVRISLNVIRLSLFVLIETKDLNLQHQIAGMFENTLWQKRFSKLGVIVMNAQHLRKDAALELVGEFVKVLIAPSVLKRFCREMQVPDKIILNYALELCKISSSFMKDRERFLKTIDTAKAALREVDVDEDTIHDVMTVINQLCPYNYEVLQLLLKQLEEWGDGRRSEYSVWLKDRLLLLEFLTLVKRQKGYTEEEVRWYRARTTNRGLDTTGAQSMSMRSVDETSILDEENQTAVPNTVSALLGGLYRKQDVFETNFPAASSDRLPFHLFLSSDKRDKLTQAIIHNELSIYNILKWSSIVEETQDILVLSRTHLIVTSIQNDVSDAVKYKRVLNDYDLNQIRELIMGVLEIERRNIILKALGQWLRKVALCDIKISIFKVCYEIAKQTLDEVETTEDIKELTTTMDAYKHTLAQSTTDLLLSKNKMLDSNTSVLSSDPVSLISYICSNCVDWNDDTNIEAHFRVVEEIAKVNEVDLSTVYDELILNWLPGAENMEMGAAHSDPDATIDFMGSDSGANAAAAFSGVTTSIDEEVPLPVLYSDPSLSKIVFLLRKCDAEKKARTIYQKFEQESTLTPGGFVTKIRTACCLIRYLTNEQMVSILSMDKNQFCARFVQLLNHRLLSVCRIGISIQDYQTTDKTEFVRSILSPQSFRSTQEVAHLLTCVIVDNEIKDIGLIGKAAARLLQLRMMRPLLVLLEYTRKFADAKNITSIAAYYGRTFEWYNDRMDPDEEESDRIRKIISLTYFLIGCPVEGGSNFLRAKNLLEANGMPCAVALVGIAGSSTEDIKVSKVINFSDSSRRDIVLNREHI